MKDSVFIQWNIVKYREQSTDPCYCRNGSRKRHVKYSLPDAGKSEDLPTSLTELLEATAHVFSAFPIPLPAPVISTHGPAKQAKESPDFCIALLS